MVNNLRTKGKVNAIGCVRKQKGAQAQQQTLENGKHHQQGAEHSKGVGAVVDDYLVDHLLNQQGVNQAKQLHEEAGQQDFQQHGAVLLQSRQEPAETKLALRRKGVNTQGENLTLLAPLLLELIKAEFLIGNGRNAEQNTGC